LGRHCHRVPSLPHFRFEVCVSIPSLALADDGTVKPDDKAAVTFTTPIIFKLNSQQMSDEGPLTEAIKCCQTLAEKFKNDNTRNEGGRMHRRLTNEANAELKKVIETLLPPGLLLPDAKLTAAVKVDLGQSTFAVARDRVTCSPEYGHIANIRLGIKGVRYIVLAPTFLLMQALSSGPGLIDPGKLNHWLKTVTTDGMTAFMSKSDAHKIYYATVGPGDCVFVPAGYIFYERVTAGGDFIGLRQPLLGLKSLPVLKEIHSKLEITSEALLRAMDCLTISSD
jgi:hypothetical protein